MRRMQRRTKLKMKGNVEKEEDIGSNEYLRVLNE